MRGRVLALVVGLFAWGAVLPAVYATFGKELQRFLQGNPLLSQFTQFGGGDVFSLSGAIALGFIHPITLFLMGVVAVGLPISAIAGERQRGTLEVTLSRPISRHALYLTQLIAGALILVALMAVVLLGSVVSAQLVGVGDEINVQNALALWANGWIFWVAILSIAFACSVSTDRIAPALGLILAFLLVSYFLDVVGSLWPDAAWLQDYSIFELVPAKLVLEHGLQPLQFLGLAAICGLAVAYAWTVFPRRDLSAPT